MYALDAVLRGVGLDDDAGDSAEPDDVWVPELSANPRSRQLGQAVISVRRWGWRVLACVPTEWRAARCCAVRLTSRLRGVTLLVLPSRQLLNTLSYPYADERSVHATLDFIRAMFAVRLDDGVGGAHLFYTNDVKVLVDVVLREIADLPPPSRVRTSFIHVLGGLMLRTQWAKDARMFRSGDIAASLEALVEQGGDDEDDDDGGEGTVAGGLRMSGAVAAAAEVLEATGDLLY